MIETFFIIFLLFFIIIFKYLYWNEAVYIKANDSREYLVRNLPDKIEASNMLVEIRSKLIKFINELVKMAEKNTDSDNELVKNYKYIKMIQKKLPYSIFKESSANSEYTSYSINKGDTLVFCLRSKLTNKLHNINEIMYVAVHEIAHIGCPEFGHTPLFKKINLFLLQKATDMKLYKFENYRKTNKEYCGITLSHNILVD